MYKNFPFYRQNSCRVCLKTKKIKKSLLNSYFEIVWYPDVFQSCTGIDILNRSDHPPWICYKCDKQLINFYSFRKTCIEADEILNSNKFKTEDLDIKPKWEDSPVNEFVETSIKSESEDEFDDETSIKSESDSESNDEEVKPTQNQVKPLVRPSTLTTDIDVTLLNPQLKCDQCDVKCTNAITLKVHKNKMHLNDCETFACSICHSSFYTENLLNKHKESHNGKQNVKCKYCEMLFNSKNARDNHERRHHSGVKPYKCLDCKDRSFFSKSEYTRHTKRLHSTERPFVCKLCNKTFSINQDLKQHMKIHENVRDFQCDICGHASLTVTNLRYHKKIVHESTEEHQCDLCSEIFKKKPALWKHKRTKHRGAHICDICGLSLMTSENLKVHKRLHDESNRRFTCPICPHKSFFKNATLRRHFKGSHPGIEPPPLLERHRNSKGVFSRLDLDAVESGN